MTGPATRQQMLGVSAIQSGRERQNRYSFFLGNKYQAFLLEKTANVLLLKSLLIRPFVREPRIAPLQLQLRRVCTYIPRLGARVGPVMVLVTD